MSFFHAVERWRDLHVELLTDWLRNEPVLALGKLQIIGTYLNLRYDVSFLV